MHIHNMKIISEVDNKFFGLKKKLISISLIAYVFTKVVMFIVHCICSALSCRLSAQKVTYLKRKITKFVARFQLS